MPILSESLIFPMRWLLSILFLFPHLAHASPRPALLEIAPRRARILPHKANAHAWDLGFGESALPDVFVVIEGNNQRLQTKIQRNTLRPYWQQKQIFALLKHHTLRIALYDKDVHRIELIGQIDIPVSQLQKRNHLRFGQVIEFILDVRPALPTHATPRPRKHPHPFHSSPVARTPSVTPVPPTTPPLPHHTIPPHTPPPSRHPTPPTTPTLPSTAPPLLPQLQEEPSKLHIHGLLRYRHSQAKIRILPNTPSVALALPSALRLYSLQDHQLLHQQHSQTLHASNLLWLSHPPTLAIGLIGGLLHLPNLQELTIPHALQLFPLPNAFLPKPSPSKSSPTKSPIPKTPATFPAKASTPPPTSRLSLPSTHTTPPPRLSLVLRPLPNALGPFFGKDNNLAYCPTQQRLAWSDAYGQIYTSTPPYTSAPKAFKLPRAPDSLAWSPDCTTLWSGGLHQPIRSHPYPPPKISSPTPSSSLPTPLPPPPHHALALLHHSDRLAWCTHQGTVVWHILSHKAPATRSITPPSSQDDLPPSPCHRLFHHAHAPALLALFPQKLALFQTHTPSTQPLLPFQEIDFSADPLLDADLDPKQQLLLTLHQSGKVRRWRWKALSLPK